MKQEFHPNYNPSGRVSHPSRTSLHQLVNRLQNGLLQQAVEKKSIIINDVDKTLSIRTDEDMLAYLIGSIMGNAVFSTSNCCIRVETVCTEDAIHVRVKNNGVFIYSSRMFSLGNIVDAATKLGGNISLETEEKGMAVVFSISNKKAA